MIKLGFELCYVLVTGAEDPNKAEHSSWIFNSWKYRQVKEKSQQSLMKFVLIEGATGKPMACQT